jgi:hypothetical protein
MFVQIATPAAGAEVPRSIEVTGSISVQFSPRHGPLTSKSVRVQFGDGGPVQAATFVTETTWRCVGQPNASLPPGATINLSVTASGTVRVLIVRGEPDIEDVDAGTSVAVRLANPPAAVTIDAFAPEVSTAQLPLAFTLAGSTSDPDANVSLVQMALDTGDFTPVDNLSGDWSRWQKALSLTAGLHRFVVQARDAGGNVTQQEAFLHILLTPAPPDPAPGSITSWTRLEPRCRNSDIGRSVGARLFDPLWLMARQWQMGEFQAVDAGAPVEARVRATSAMLSRCHFGQLPANTVLQPPRFNPLRKPLEAVVERRPMRPRSVNDQSMLTLSVEAGLHFLHMLEQQPLTGNYRAPFIARYALQPLPAAVAAATDEATRRFARTMAGRAPDARRLAAAFRGSGAATVAHDPSLPIAAGDRAEVQQTAQAWLVWYDSLFEEPLNPADEAWDPARMEYALTVSASFSDNPFDQMNLSATEFDDGYLDWKSFDADLEVNLGSSADHTFSGVTETTVPAPVSFRGAPAVRFWELEESRLAYGLLPVGPPDLAQLMMIEYAGSYGNDWFVVPLTLPIGSITRVNSLVVTDSFGVRILLQPIGAPATPASGFGMWQHEFIRRPGSDMSGAVHNMLFLPPTAGRSPEGAALEDVVFMRDEMANVAWAIERSIESPVEQARVYTTPASASAAAAPVQGGVPQYLLASTVPENWIPLLPVQLQDTAGKVISRLKRGAVLQPDGTQKVHRAHSQALNIGANVLLHDEDVPREGVHITRTRNAARWIDGSTCVWTAFRKQVGRGEGSSGLRFDQLNE